MALTVATVDGMTVYQAIKEAPVDAVRLCTELEAAISKRLHKDTDSDPTPDGHLATSRLSYTDWSIVQIRMSVPLTQAEQDAAEAAIAAHVA